MNKISIKDSKYYFNYILYYCKTFYSSAGVRLFMMRFPRPNSYVYAIENYAGSLYHVQFFLCGTLRTIIEEINAAPKQPIHKITAP